MEQITTKDRIYYTIKTARKLKLGFHTISNNIHEKISSF